MSSASSKYVLGSSMNVFVSMPEGGDEGVAKMKTRLAIIFAKFVIVIACTMRYFLPDGIDARAIQQYDPPASSSGNSSYEQIPANAKTVPFLRGCSSPICLSMPHQSSYSWK
ncbi:hypothetical protein L2E82_17309 [Cichorium intybus]|uniref:Uncharacterized protein n=1 Tax=Cichorium intybus TaxID=13427 RepID=A0ACB9F8J8_CICIN|nr:hypothetical protein L2E82_17309 [Cichorium intybus]